jgi:hypothetical protein
MNRRLHGAFRAIFLGFLALLTAAAGCGSDEPAIFGGSGGAAPEALKIKAAPAGIRQILARQYVNSVELMFGKAAATASDPPNAEKLYGLRSIGASELSLSASIVEDYESAARRVADAVVSDSAAFAKWLVCEPKAFDDEACLGKVVTAVGRVAWRRQLSKDEVSAITKVGLAAAKEYKTFEEAVRYAVITLLQSPDFLYIVEIGEAIPEGDRDADADDDKRKRLTGSELVTRMSFFLTDTTPSADMLDAAEDGGLETDEQIRAAAEQLLATAGAKAALNSFYGESIFLEQLATKLKDADVFPDYDAALAASMRTSVEKLIEDIVWTRDVDFRQFITAEEAFVDSRLAGLYGLKNASDIEGFEKKKIPSSQKRVGFLGSAAFNTIESHVAHSSPTKRGAFIHSHLLCAKVPPPPANVDTTLPVDDPKKPKTAKQKLEAHMDNPSCSGCHARIDPPGYALETFDAIGRFRSKYENGLAIDTSGETEEIGEFDDAKDLAGQIHDNPNFAVCMLLKVFRNSMGRLETRDEAAAVKALIGEFIASEYKMQDLLSHIVLSPAFRLVGAPK